MKLWQFAQELETTLQSLHETGATDMPTVAHIGLAPYDPRRRFGRPADAG